MPNEADIPMSNAYSFTKEAMAKGAPSTLRVPYAEVPYDRDGIVGLQRFGLTEAEAMVSFWNQSNGAGGNRKGACGYVGHPDYLSSPESAEKFLREEPEAVVWITGINATNDALELQVEWTPQGEKMVTERKYRFFSPFWLSEHGPREKGTQIFYPRVLQSLGLTNNPNWKMPPIINSSSKHNGGNNKGESQMKDWLLKLKKLLNSESEISEDGALDIFKAMANSLATMRTKGLELTKGKTYAETPEGTASLMLDTINTQTLEVDRLGKVETANSTLSVEMQTLRKTCATTLVNSAVLKGTVLKDHINSKVEEMVNATDFATSVECLNALPPLMKVTDKHSKDASKGSMDVHTRRAKIQGLVNSAQANGLNYDQAFAKVQADSPELFPTAD